MSARTLARRALCLCSRIMWLQPQRQAPCPSLPSVLTSGLTPYLQHSWGVSSMSISITAFTPGFRLGPTEIGLWLRPVQESRRQGCGEGAGVLGCWEPGWNQQQSGCSSSLAPLCPGWVLGLWGGLLLPLCRGPGS